MKIVPFDDGNWVKDHPTGDYSFQHLLKGEPNTLENFMLVISRQDADFWMPLHRHNFEQIRFPLVGAMNHGALDVGEGEVGYIPEGLPYGPQNDPLGKYAPGERKQIVLQFGGSSGCGFISIEQRREALAHLKAIGKMDGPYYVWPDGTKEWGLNAVWRHIFGKQIKYPRPRYKTITIADPKRFNWLPLAGANGVEHKFMGSFSERAVALELIKVRANALWSSSDERTCRLFVVLSGEGEAAGVPVRQWTALKVDAGETLALKATTEMQLFLMALPPIELPVAESEEFDAEELPSELIPA